MIWKPIVWTQMLVTQMLWYSNVFHSNVLSFKTFDTQMFWKTTWHANVLASFCCAEASKSHQIHPSLILHPNQCPSYFCAPLARFFAIRKDYKHHRGWAWVYFHFATQPFQINFVSKIFLFPECSDSLLWWCKGSTLQHKSHIKCIPLIFLPFPHQVSLKCFAAKLSFQSKAFFLLVLLAKLNVPKLKSCIHL